MSRLKKQPNFPDIHPIKLPLSGSALGFVNSYLIMGENGHLLVDTGWNTRDTLEAFEEQIQALNVAWRDISTIIITHVHTDHFGLVGKLQRRSNARVMMHEKEKDLIDLRFRNSMEFARIANITMRRTGAPEPFIPSDREIAERFIKLADVVNPDQTLKDGEILCHGKMNLEVIWTPGHSPGHICLYEQKRRLFFSGDHVLSPITPHIGFYPQAGIDPLGQYVQSLTSIRSLDVEWILPAHGLLFDGFGARVDQIIAHHGFRSRQLIDLIKNAGNPQNPFELARQLTWHRKKAPVLFQDLSHLDRRLAVLEVLAHLESLKNKGIVTSEEQDGVLCYRLVQGRTSG